MERLTSREEWKRAEAEIKTLFPEQVNRVAVLLGMTARFTGKNGEPYYYSIAWLEGEGRCVCLTTRDSHPDFRLSVSGDYDDMGPDDSQVSSYGIDKPSISVSLRRPVEVIAKEIKSRFLPGYDAARAQIAERVTEATARYNLRRSSTDRLAKIAGVQLRKNVHTSELPYDFFKYYGKVAYSEPKIEVKVSDSGSVDIKIDCGVELAAKIIEAIEHCAK